MNTATALLPMKAHSERVPGKNLRLMAGRPLYAWVLSALLESSSIAAVVVNTDSEAIMDGVAHISERVVIHERPEDLRGDEVSMNRIIAHDIGLLGEGHYLQTHATNPLLTAATIDRAVNRYFEAQPEHDSLFGVTRLQTRLYDAAGTPMNHDPAALLRTQDLAPVYEENSTLYLFSAAGFQRADSNRIGRSPIMFEVDRIQAVDIDEETDWLLAEALIAMQHRGERP
ncbi:acylneuraminate cytidylyltransferase family protein [Oceanidesulfovibrio indonesiensis]|uniref:Acylneuraminate cytidylyltransferase family protein n=1 Tax=Oceanidesulfovibrio indonesiensis TaxID=54767 RepID=A0A7M3MA56_9BACT|nr:acylneuraminate cytidylyltransferase family protein [Oceanidesulfovibrio indonesiensis]TVM14362.1 acylneuraminate cytidylyltransferase family protein [Oceanidesulfovibrio indonesiensis]